MTYLDLFLGFFMILLPKHAKPPRNLLVLQNPWLKMVLKRYEGRILELGADNDIYLLDILLNNQLRTLNYFIMK